MPAGEDCGYAEFMATVDALVMGRHTFEKVLTFPAWPYADKPVWVLSRSLRDLPPGLPASVRLLNATPAQLVALATEEGWQRLYIDGGQTVQSFLAAGCLTDLTVTVVPALLGRGLRLFRDGGCDRGLSLAAAQVYPFGFVQSRYEVAPSF